MNSRETEVNAPLAQGVAGITNVGLFAEALGRTTSRNKLLPGIVAFYGPSGFGKSVAATFVANRLRAYYVQATSTCTKKSFLLSILKEMGIPAAKTIYEMLDQVAGELAKSGKPLIVDEFDHLVNGSGNKVELVRDIYEASQGTILIIGEELLPRKLAKWERFSGRVLHWVAAEPATLSDARALAGIYASRVSIDDYVLEELVATVRGSTRRVCTNLESLHERALELGVSTLDRTELKRVMPEGFTTGESPRPRSF